MSEITSQFPPKFNLSMFSAKLNVKLDASLNDEVQYQSYMIHEMMHTGI